MILGTVTRQGSREDGTGTPGREELDNGFACDTLELGWHNNEKGRSCTAPGVDKGRVWYSPHLERLVIKYEDRGGRADCEQHNGNHAGDVALHEHTQIHGCTLVGQGYGPVKAGGVTQWGILNSVKTLDALLESLRIQGEDVTIGADGYASGYHDVEITYLYAEGCEP